MERLAATILHPIRGSHSIPGSWDSPALSGKTPPLFTRQQPTLADTCSSLSRSLSTKYSTSHHCSFSLQHNTRNLCPAPNSYPPYHSAFSYLSHNRLPKMTTLSSEHASALINVSWPITFTALRISSGVNRDSDPLPLLLLSCQSSHLFPLPPLFDPLLLILFENPLTFRLFSGPVPVTTIALDSSSQSPWPSCPSLTPALHPPHSK